MKYFVVLILIFSAITSLTTAISGHPKNTRLSKRGHSRHHSHGVALKVLQELAGATPYEALVHMPPVSSNGKLLPLLLYLHGGGESGGDLHGIISEGATGTPPVELEHNQALPILTNEFVMVAPHTTSGWTEDGLSNFVDFLLSDASGLHLDDQRLYVTGHSMGAGACISAARTHRFAAAAPFALTSSSTDVAAIMDVAFWCFHGKNDVICNYQNSQNFIDSLLAAGASEDDARLTLFDDAPTPPGWPTYTGHASTIPGYKTPELYTWLLNHTLERLPKNMY